MFKKSRKGQSVLEYVLVITAVIAAILVVVVVFLRPRVQTSLDAATGQIETQVNKLAF